MFENANSLQDTPENGAAISAMSEQARRLDDLDPLSAGVREFAVGGLIHLNGNSLGPPRVSLVGELERVVSDQWARHQVRAWFDDGWLELPRTVGEKLGMLLGAAPGQVVVAGETTSTILFNAMVAACRLREERPVLLIEASSFPTDLYVAGSVARLLRRRLVVESGEGFDAFLGERGTEVGVAVASPVDFRTGQRRDIASTTALCHGAGAVSVWDLSHAAGVLPTALDEHGVDLAVGCGYKYLGGGPGAPAFLYVADRLQSAVDLPLCGWHGHSDPFAMAPEFVAAAGIDRGRTGTPPLLSLVALNHALDPLVQAGIVALHRRSCSLSDFFLACIDERSPDLATLLISPRDAARRGGHLTLRMGAADDVERQLAQRGVLVDFRMPDMLRLAFAPLYVTHADVWRAVQQLDDVMSRPR
jgi:kynureninase